MTRIELRNTKDKSVGHVSADLIPAHLLSEAEGFNGTINVVVVPDWHKDYKLTPEEYEALYEEELAPCHYAGHKEEELIHALLECDYNS